MNSDKHNEPLKQHGSIGGAAGSKPDRLVNAEVLKPAGAIPDLKPRAERRKEGSLASFQSALRGWLSEMEKELPAPSQQSVLSYLEENFERLSLDLHQKVTEAQNAL